MNRLVCFLTGGHRYSDVNIRTQTMPDDFNIVEITHPCIKCGTLSAFYMNVGKMISHDAEIKRMRGGEEE